MTMTLTRSEVRRMVVFRALMLGDLLCATPALRALRGAFPQASITLVSLPWAAALARRLRSVDEFIAFCGHPRIPELSCEEPELTQFLAQMKRKHFDFAIQLHGSGEISNPVVAAFGAARTAGFAGPGAWRPETDHDRFAQWPQRGNEIERLLHLTDHLGLGRQGVRLDFPVEDSDRRELAALWPGAFKGSRYVCIHAGAQLPSRRWGAARFAAVADALAQRGRTIVLTGTAGEIPLVAEVAAAMTRQAVNLCGRTSLWTLGALIEGAEGVICNDTGISHIAAALARPSVVVSCGSDPARWAPLDRQRHRVLAAPAACRPCSFRTCPIAHECAAGTQPSDVIEAYLRSGMPSADHKTLSLVQIS